MERRAGSATLRSFWQPPRGALTATEYLELQFLAAAGLILGLLGIASTIAFPLVLGFGVLDFSINLATTAVLTASGVLALLGHRRASGWVLLVTVTGAIWVVIFRNEAGPLHDLFVLANVLPILLAFTLRRRWFAVLLVGGAFGYIAAEVWLGRDLAGMMSVAVVLAGTVAAAGIGPLLRGTEERRAAAAERDVRRLLRQLQEAQDLAHVGSWELDQTTGGAAWSDEMYRIFGVQHAGQPLLAAELWTSVHPEDLARVRAGFEQASDSGERFVVEHRIVRPDGTVRDVSSTVRFERDANGRTVRAVGTTQDVTERKAAEAAHLSLQRTADEVERLHQVARMRADFLNAAAHDLRTPLTPVQLQMGAFRLKRDTLPVHVKDGLDLLQRNLDRFQRLVEDLVDASRLQAGKLRLRRQPTRLEPLVRDVVATFGHQAADAGITLEESPLPDVEVDVDPAKCVQVLVNLVSNAIRYSKSGGHVRIETEVRPGEVEMRFADEGIGLTPEQVGRLFQPFGRLHEDQVASGTGLGLYISKGIVEQHGGRIWAESPGPGAGSTFHVTWPRARQDGPGAPPPVS